jgi:excisionase family DNA binding protein
MSASSRESNRSEVKFPSSAHADVCARPSPPRRLPPAPGSNAPAPNLADDLLTIAEVARLLRHHPKTIERWARTGRLPCYRVGGRVLFSRGDILQWLAERRAGPQCRD